jgi:hypothetical protein
MYGTTKKSPYHLLGYFYNKNNNNKINNNTKAAAVNYDQRHTLITFVIINFVDLFNRKQFEQLSVGANSKKA